MSKLKIALNNPQVIKDLLQEAYMLASAQIVEAQNEINKMASATNLTEEAMDGKEKYGKIINNYLAIKDKAISKKIEISKVLTEIYHHNGKIGEALEESGSAMKSFDFEQIKKIVDENRDKTNETETIIELKR